MTPDRIARRIALASIFISASLAAAKISIGLKADSAAVISDGLESAGDVLASGLVLFGLSMAAKPPDAEHPYGHGRVETLTGLIVGMMLISAGALICYGSTERAFDLKHAPASFAIWPVLASIIVKGNLWWAKLRLSRKIRSEALRADAWNDGVDTLSGCTALLGVGITLFNPNHFMWADHAGGALVGLIVIFLGAHVVRDTTLQLMDTMPEARAMQQIKSAALSVPGALGIEKCFARKTGLKYHVDLHLEVDPGMTVYESHQIASRVRDRIREELDWVADVLVHVEPHMLATISDRPHGKP